MKKFWIVFVIAVLFIGVVLGIFWRLMRSLETGGPAVEGGVLVWRVAEDYQEEREDSLLGYLLAGRQPLMREVIFALRHAATDDKIEGLLLHILAVPVDWAKIEELREAVQAFAASGKPVVAYLEGVGTKEYALAVAADEVILAPEGNLLVLGISAELTFIKNTLNKLGMQADFIHVGKYKSAPEALTRESASPAYREMVESIVDERYKELTAMIAAGRSVAIEEARHWIDVGIYDAPTALATGLVDTLLHLEDVLATRFDTEARTSLDDYHLARRVGRPAAKVALIYTTGTIVPGKSRRDNLEGKYAGSETVVEQLHRAGEDESIAAVILRVDSPGGSATASDLIWHEVTRVRRQKPVVVSMSGYAASGGYYVSCGADSIFAEPGTLTGSIGVFAGKVDMHGFYEKIGVEREYVTRGENALLLYNHAPFTPAQRERVTLLLEDFYGRFLQRVAEGRGLEVDQVARVAEGRVWTGKQAVEHRLVDGLGGLSRAVDATKSMLGLVPHDRVSLVSYERRLSFLERLLLRSLQENSWHPSALQPLRTWPWEITADLARDGTLTTVPLLDGRALALLPYRVHFR